VSTPWNNGNIYGTVSLKFQTRNDFCFLPCLLALLSRGAKVDQTVCLPIHPR